MKLTMEMMKNPKIFENFKNNFSLTVYSGQKTPENQNIEEVSKYRCILRIENGKIEEKRFQQRFHNNRYAYDTGVNWQDVNNAGSEGGYYIEDNVRLQDTIDTISNNSGISGELKAFYAKVEDLINSYMKTFWPSKPAQIDVDDIPDQTSKFNPETDIQKSNRFANLDIDDESGKTISTPPAPTKPNAAPNPEQFVTSHDREVIKKEKELEDIRNGILDPNRRTKAQEKHFSDMRTGKIDSNANTKETEEELRRRLRNQPKGTPRGPYEIDESRKRKKSVLNERMENILKALLGK